MSEFNNVTVVREANIYFDGAVASRTVIFPDGTKKTLGLMQPGEYTFNTGAAEIMECVAGSCEYKLAGTDEWKKSTAGDKFAVPANSSFEIRVAEPYHYICHYA